MPVFYAQWVERVKPPEKGRDEHFDEKVPGLILRVSSTGRKSWYVMYGVKGEPNRRRHLLGEYPVLTLGDAREQAARFVLEAKAGVDLGAERRALRVASTVAELCEEYLVRHAIKKRSGHEDRRRINKHIVPAWGDWKVGELKRRHVIALLDDIALRTPVEANRVLALVRRIYSWAMSRDLAEANPCMGIEAPGEEAKRDRVLSDDEIRAFWYWTDAKIDRKRVLTEAMRDIFRLRLITGQRGGEVAAMHWTHIDLATGVWKIPAGVAKNKTEHIVPLTPMALEILGRRGPGEGWVFPTRKGKNGEKGHVRVLGIALGDLQKACGFAFWGHDLRRTAATAMGNLNFDDFVIGLVLNHKTGRKAVTGTVYNQARYLGPMREAMTAWDAKLQTILANSWEPCQSILHATAP